MKKVINVFPAHVCQLCGSERKYVETVIDDEFFWNEKDLRYEPHTFTDCFEHTGSEQCAVCTAVWTGMYESR